MKEFPFSQGACKAYNAWRRSKEKHKNSPCGAFSEPSTLEQGAKALKTTTGAKYIHAAL